MWRKGLAVFSSAHTSKEVLIAQMDAYRRRVPILYVVLIINTLALAATHVGIAPPLASLFMPMAIVAVMMVRLVYWLKVWRDAVSEEAARRDLRNTNIVGMVLGAASITWCLMLYPYGTSAEGGVSGTQAHTVLFVGLTVISCSLFMMHARIAALSVTLIVIPVFSGYLLYRGSMIEIAMALNLVLVAIAVIYVLTFYAKDFERLVLAKNDLILLNDANAVLANTDAVTGLPNRRRFFAVLEQAVAAKLPFSVAVLDLDGFKQINDLHGHVVGDEVLAEIGRRLVDQAPGACVARMGGDEFALIVKEDDPGDVMALAEDLIDACRAPIKLEHVVAHVGASVGLSLASGDEPPSISHYEHADYALFHAKKSGRGRAEIFAPEHERLTRDTSIVEQALRRADLEREIELVYQPIVRADDEAVVAFEALARWQSPELGAVPPNVFIPIAESNELIFELTRTIVHKAFAEAAAWPPHILLKINLSVRDLTSPEQMVRLLSILRQAPIQVKRVTFEITETVLAEDVEAVSSAISSLRYMGATVAIDDFGVGYSNLSYVQRLAPDLIKIDKSFVDRLAVDPGTLGIVKTILELCRNVGAGSIAEGVETKLQADILRSVGCNEFQGYYFSRPLVRSAAKALANAQVERVDQPAAAG